MIWFFTRGAAQIDVEVHRGTEPGAYTLAVTYPDGAERSSSSTRRLAWSPAR